MPSRFLLTIASSLDCTIDAKKTRCCCVSRRSASICLRSVTSRLTSNHRAVTEKLHPAFYNDFVAILADMTQFARPMTFISKPCNQLDKFDREFCLKQSVASAPDCLFQRKAIKPFGPGVPKFNAFI